MDITWQSHQNQIVIFFAAKNGEALYSQQKQDQELIVAQSSGFPYFLPFKSEFGSKEFMISATVSSHSSFLLTA